MTHVPFLAYIHIYTGRRRNVAQPLRHEMELADDEAPEAFSAEERGRFLRSLNAPVTGAYVTWNEWEFWTKELDDLQHRVERLESQLEKKAKKGWPTIHISQEVEQEPYIIVEQELNIIAREMDSSAWEMRWRRSRTRDVEGQD